MQTIGVRAMCRPGWGNFCAFDWNSLPVGREFDGKFLKNVKSPPHALPPKIHTQNPYPWGGTYPYSLYNEVLLTPGFIMLFKVVLKYSI